MQLRRFLPAYAEVLASLDRRYPSCRKLNMLYHNDIVGRYICRILNIFLTRKTQLLDADYLRWIYDMMAADPQQGIFSVRFAQAGNMLLYKIGNIDLSLKVYRFCSRLTSVLRKK